MNHVIKNTIIELDPKSCYKKQSSGAGNMLTKTENSGAEAISFLQELRSPGFDVTMSSFLSHSWIPVLWRMTLQLG